MRVFALCEKHIQLLGQGFSDKVVNMYYTDSLDNLNTKQSKIVGISQLKIHQILHSRAIGLNKPRCNYQLKLGSIRECSPILKTARVVKEI